jgi:hypothetical protein
MQEGFGEAQALCTRQQIPSGSLAVRWYHHENASRDSRLLIIGK